MLILIRKHLICFKIKWIHLWFLAWNWVFIKRAPNREGYDVHLSIRTKLFERNHMREECCTGVAKCSFDNYHRNAKFSPSIYPKPHSESYIISHSSIPLHTSLLSVSSKVLKQWMFLLHYVENSAPLRRPKMLFRDLSYCTTYIYKILKFSLLLL